MTHTVAPIPIRTIEIRSNLVKISFKILVERMQLKTIVRDEVELRVIMSPNAKLPMIIDQMMI
jgi:hypothetical protein